MRRARHWLCQVTPMARPATPPWCVVFVTVGVPAEEIHAVGLEQVAKIREEIQVTLDEHFGGGDVSGVSAPGERRPRLYL